MVFTRVDTMTAIHIMHHDKVFKLLSTYLESVDLAVPGGVPQSE